LILYPAKYAFLESFKYYPALCVFKKKMGCQEENSKIIILTTINQNLKQKFTD